MPIGIGTLLSGEKSALGREILEGAAAFVKDHPSILGHRMALLHLDDGCDVAITIRQAETFCAMNPRPVAVVGYLCSPGSLAALPIHGACRIPLLNVSSGDPRLTRTESSWVLRLWTSRARQAPLVLRWIKKKRYRRVLLIHEADHTSQAIAMDFALSRPKLSRRTKAQIIALDDIHRASSKPFATKVLPQLIYYVGQVAALEALWRKLPSKALKKPWILDQRASHAVLESIEGPHPKQLYSILLTLPTGDSQSLPFRYYRGRFGEPGVYTLAAFDAMAVFTDAFQKVARQVTDGTAWDPTELMQALRKTQLQGLTGPISFDERGDRVGAAGKILKWKKEDWVPSWQRGVP